jgi:hypothetical protein
LWNRGRRLTTAAARIRHRELASRGTKESRAGWPGFLCVELDAVTSQRGAAGAEAASGWLWPIRSPGALPHAKSKSPNRGERFHRARKQTEAEVQVSGQVFDSSETLGMLRNIMIPKLLSVCNVGCLLTASAVQWAKSCTSCTGSCAPSRFRVAPAETEQATSHTDFLRYNSGHLWFSRQGRIWGPTRSLRQQVLAAWERSTAPATCG